MFVVAPPCDRAAPIAAARFRDRSAATDRGSPVAAAARRTRKLRINAGMFAAASDESNSALAGGAAHPPITAIT